MYLCTVFRVSASETYLLLIQCVPQHVLLVYNSVPTSTQQAIPVVESIDPGAVANQGRGQEGSLIPQLGCPQPGPQVDPLPVGCVLLLDHLVHLLVHLLVHHRPPAQLATSILPHFRTGADHLERKYFLHYVRNCSMLPKMTTVTNISLKESATFSSHIQKIHGGTIFLSSTYLNMYLTLTQLAGSQHQQ